MTFLDAFRQFCCAIKKNHVDQFTKVKELDSAQNVQRSARRPTPVNLSSAQLLYQLQCSAQSEASWLSRIGTCLSACKLALRAADARVVLFGGETLAAWVFAEEGNVVQADGWGRLLRQLSEQTDSVGIMPSSDDRQHPVRQAVGPYGSRPVMDQAALVCRPVDKSLRLAQGELLVLPVREGPRLAAALIVDLFGDKGDGDGGGGREGAAAGYDSRPGAMAGAPVGRVLAPGRRPGGAAPAEAGLCLDPEELYDMLQLARIVALSILGAEPNHARFLSKAADLFGQLPLCQSLSGLMGGLLHAMQHLLALRFSLHLAPVLALTHGGSGGGRAVLFTQRHIAAGGGGGGTVTGTSSSAAWSGVRTGGGGGGDSLLETYASVQSLLALAASSAGPRSLAPHRAVSELSAQVERERTNSVTEGCLAGVKAVRVALPNTLLSEALRARSSLLAIVGDGGASVSGAADRAAQPQQLQQPQQLRFNSVILRNAGGFILEEQQPCRDILTIGKLMGGAVGSLVLCFEATQRTAAGGGGGAAAAARKAGEAVASSGGGGGVLSPPQGRIPSGPHGRGGSSPLRVAAVAAALTTATRGSVNDSYGGGGGGSCSGGGYAGVAAATAAAAAAAGLQEAADAVLLASPVFALYLVSADPLPYSVLDAVVQECKLLLGLLLDAVRMAVAAGGRAAAELRMLQLQLLDPAGGGGAGGGGGGAAGGLLSGTAASPQIQVQIQERAAAAGKAVKRLISGHAVRGSAGGCSAALEARPGSAHVAGLGRLGSAATDSRVPGPGGVQLLASAGLGLDLLDREPGSPLGGALQQWMLASSPELTLEAAPGPSQLEMMVSTMRSQLGSVIAEAETAHEARSAMAQDMAALDLHEMIGRGGQGVVFKGLLHGLETAIKLNVCRDGEPLEEEEPCGVADKATVIYDIDGLVTTAEWEEWGARLRKAKRGALERAIMPTLSHPNIVQVYATFSNVVTVKCTYRGERQARLRLVSRDDAILANMTNQGPLNQVICFEYCDRGTLLEAAHAGAFRPPGASAFTAIARPALVPLYMSLLEVALALRYLHSRRLVHCDVKPANVLLKGSSRDPRGWTCKLSDFGCARLMTEIASSSESPAHHPCGHHHHQAPADPAGSPPAPPPGLGFRMAAPLGTVAYMAPELFLKGQVLTAAVDIYAFGILMYEVLTCRTPYSDMPPAEVPRNVVRCHLRPEFHPLAPAEYCSLTSRCWAASPGRRPTACDLVSELEKLLKLARRSEEKRQEQVSWNVRQGSRPAASAASMPPPPRVAAAAAVAPPVVITAAAPDPASAASAAAAGEAPAAAPAPLPLPPSACLRPDAAPVALQRRPPGGRLMARFDEHPIAAARDDPATASQTHAQAAV